MAERGAGGELEVLSTQECRRLLAGRQVGRLGVVAEHYPLIVPVTYALDDDVIVVRSGPGLKLAAASHANVTFEVDEVDQATRSGWSVLVRGLAEEVTDEHDASLRERTRATGVAPWAPGEHEHWLRIIPHDVSGRRITAAHLDAPQTAPGYL